MRTLLDYLCEAWWCTAAFLWGLVFSIAVGCCVVFPIETKAHYGLLLLFPPLSFLGILGVNFCSDRTL